MAICASFNEGNDDEAATQVDATSETPAARQESVDGGQNTAENVVTRHCELAVGDHVHSRSTTTATLTHHNTPTSANAKVLSSNIVT